MKRKKIFKTLMIIIFLITIVILFEQNITAVREDNIDNKIKNSVLTLESNSELIKNLYEKLDLELVNNICTKCLSNDNYSFLFFENYEKSKNLSDTEKLYFVFNSLYKQDLLEKKEDKDSGTVFFKVTVDTVKEELTKLFGDTNFDTFEHDYKISQTCGITDYTYTGVEYELKYEPCSTKHEFAKSRQINSYKKDNYIYIVTEAFFVTADTKADIDSEKEVLKVQNFNNDELLEKTSLSRLNDDAEEIFDAHSIDKFTFRFELKGDNYYLKDILKGDNF